MTRQLQTDTLADRRKRKFSFFANALLKKEKNKKELPTLNFLSGFLSNASFSTFASRSFLFVEKITNKSRTPFGKLAKELNSARKTKTPAKKFSFAPASWTVAYILTAFCSGDGFAQIQTPKTPTFENKFTPVTPTQSHTTGQPQKQETYTQPTHNYGSALQPKKAEAIMPDNIYNSLNKNNFVLTSNSTIPSKSVSSVDIVHSVLSEMKTFEPSINYHFPSLASASGYNNFTAAYNEISDMLEGRKPLDLKRAAFLTENAFFGNQMNYSDYQKSIAEMAMLVQLKMQQEKLPFKDNDAILYMAHQYFTDTLDIKLPVQEKTATTFPKTYDFQDPFGYENPTKMFVSKLIAENTGQCKSLPLLFLILIYEMGGNAYLSFSPSHSYIKCQDKNGVWYNIELTNGTLTSDSWVVGSGYVKSEAVKSGIFLDTLNKKQIIANCLVDLAQYYTWRYNAHDDFVLKCVNKAIDYHSNNIWAIQVKSDYYSLLFKYVSEQKGYTKPEDLRNDPKAKELFMQRNRMYALIDGLGYQPMPEQAYMDWLKTLNEKAQKQEHEQNYFIFSKIIR